MNKRFFVILALLIPITAFAQQSVDFAVEGVSDSVKNSLQQDREEALLDAKLKAIEQAGVPIQTVIAMEDFELKKDWVEKTAEALISPDFQIIEFGYGEDSLYYVALFGKVSQRGVVITEGDKKFRRARLMLDKDKVPALEILEEVVDEYGDCNSADDALYYLMVMGDFNLREERLSRMRADYSDSPLLDSAQTYIENYNISTESFGGMEFVFLPGGIIDIDNTSHEIDPFYIQRTELTQAQWRQVMEKNPSKNKSDDNPVESVSYKNILKFIKKLNKLEGDEVYRLPTKDEWEYACRAGSKGKYCFGSDEKRLDDYAWNSNNSGKATQQVATGKPNVWGLYDMHGNVWEWCVEQKNKKRISIIRGGSWNSGAEDLTCSTQKEKPGGKKFLDVGFRLVRVKEIKNLESE